MPLTPESRNVGSRWTEKIAEAGWTPVSDYFLDTYASLVPQITSMEAMLIIHLVAHKWTKAAPFPGYTTLAKHMGITPTSVRNHARSLEKKGYLRREARVSKTNKFHLDGLFKALEAELTANPPKKGRAKADAG